MNDIDPRLLERSRNCPICREVVSAICSGADTEKVLLEGLLAASDLAREAQKVALEAVSRSPIRDVVLGTLP